MFNPTRFYLLSGQGFGNTKLNSIDSALISSGIGNCNLVRISSILPPGCLYERKIEFKLGEFIPIVYSILVTDKQNVEIATAVGVGIPINPKFNGIIMEYSLLGSSKEAKKMVESMIEEGMERRGYSIKEIITTSNQSHLENKHLFVASFSGLILYQ